MILSSPVEPRRSSVLRSFSIPIGRVARRMAPGLLPSLVAVLCAACARAVPLSVAELPCPVHSALAALPLDKVAPVHLRGRVALNPGTFESDTGDGMRVRVGEVVFGAFDVEVVLVRVGEGPARRPSVRASSFKWDAPIEVAPIEGGAPPGAAQGPWESTKEAFFPARSGSSVGLAQQALARDLSLLIVRVVTGQPEEQTARREILWTVQLADGTIGVAGGGQVTIRIDLSGGARGAPAETTGFRP